MKNSLRINIEKVSASKINPDKDFMNAKTNRIEDSKVQKVSFIIAITTKSPT